MEAKHPQRHRLRLVRVIRARPRLFVAALASLIVIAALPGTWRLSTRLLTGWDIGVALYLLLALRLMGRAEIAHIRGHAALQDEGRIAMLAGTVAAALASLGAILAELGASGGHSPLQLAGVTATIVLSWVFIQVIFALHYAHEYYGGRGEESHGEHGRGLAFPGDEAPDYWDFLYFSLVIGMTSQVSDVTITAKAIRRTVAAHGVVAFAFNAALVALTVNIAASALSAG
jgi:uncharacterized membrane protein